MSVINRNPVVETKGPADHGAQRIPAVEAGDASSTEVIGRIHSVETCGTVDGPGIRFIVFMQGCLMRCKYCHNRDTWDLDTGPQRTVGELIEEILPYKPFMQSTGGGLTVTGGEPLLQPAFVAALFEEAQKHGLHTCLDTNGRVVKITPIIERVLDHTDLVMLDLKHIDEKMHIELTGISNKWALAFARYLHERGQPTWIRYVVVPGYTTDVKWAEQLAAFLEGMDNVQRLELLPYHELGKHKWELLGEKYPLEGTVRPDDRTLETLKTIFVAHGINAIY